MNANEIQPAEYVWISEGIFLSLCVLTTFLFLTFSECEYHAQMSHSSAVWGGGGVDYPSSKYIMKYRMLFSYTYVVSYKV